MTTQKQFVITKVAWHTKRAGNLDPPEGFYRRFWMLADLLQRHGLTEEWLQFMRTGHQKWLRMLDRGDDPSDTRILGQEVTKQRIGA